APRAERATDRPKRGGGDAQRRHLAESGEELAPRRSRRALLLGAFGQSRDSLLGGEAAVFAIVGDPGRPNQVAKCARSRHRSLPLCVKRARKIDERIPWRWSNANRRHPFTIAWSISPLDIGRQVDRSFAIGGRLDAGLARGDGHEPFTHPRRFA